MLEDGVTHGVIRPMHIPEYDMVADPMTKYLTYGVWRRLTHYMMNHVGSLPERVTKKAT